MQLAGKTVLLTGASGGIGHAIARALHGEGASLILTGRRAEVLAELASELDARTLAVDLSDHAALRGLAEEAGDVDVLVANAALPGSGDLDSYDETAIDRVLDVNLRAPIMLTRLLGERMVARGSGQIVLIGSLSGKAASAHSSLYNATKFGLRGFALAMRGELAGRGVGVSGIYPGFIRDAGMFADSGAQLPPGVGTRTPEDVARAVVDAIRRNRAEVDVAPLPLRAGAAVFGLAPEFSLRFTRRTGGERIAEQLAAGQADKR